ncbi:MAG: hypothetical protein M0D55_12505 [Elusimicrobiota bacterium]|nr:MAG: hypothetical protein M0D55_12505 [Elusimicrobiota bacterium]
MDKPHDSTAEHLSETGPLGTEDAVHVAVAPAPTADPIDATPYADAARYSVPASPIENVLLIDGDNDPHVPPDARVTRHTLVRVFLRPGALLPRNLEKPLARLPNFCTVTSPKGGANAADFVMSLHAGMLHAVLPQSVPFLMVTNDATLTAMTAELQRLGRVATVWTSHRDMEAELVEAESGTTGGYESAGTTKAKNHRRRGGRGRSTSSRGTSSSSSSRGGRSRGGRGRSSSRSTPPEAALEGAQAAPPPAPVSDEPRKAGGKTLAEAAWTYASRLQRIKDVPSRVKTLLNDIKNRAGSHGFSPEEILEELKRNHGVRVDGQGRVAVDRVKPVVSEEPASPEEAAS